MKKLTFVLMLFVTSLTAWAKPQTVTLDLPTMNCTMCPITVKKALTKVDGVSRAEVSYEDKEAMVTFDDEKTSADALIEATTHAGYPSTIKNKAN